MAGYYLFIFSSKNRKDRAFFALGCEPLCEKRVYLRGKIAYHNSIIYCFYNRRRIWKLQSRNFSSLVHTRSGFSEDDFFMRLFTRNIRVTAPQYNIQVILFLDFRNCSTFHGEPSTCSPGLLSGWVVRHKKPGIGLVFKATLGVGVREYDVFKLRFRVRRLFIRIVLIYFARKAE